MTTTTSGTATGSGGATRNVRWFADLGLADLDQVGGKNASLGEMVSNLAELGVRVPDGFATTAEAFHRFIATDVDGNGGLADRIAGLLDGLDTDDVRRLAEVGREIREAVVAQPFPEDLEADIRSAYDRLVAESAGDQEPSFAVRSSATAEDLPDASFAGQQETFLNVRGIDAVLTAIREVYASLYNDRAIAYRVHHGFEHADVGLSAGVQRMVRSDLGASGVMFTMDTESGFTDAVFITSAFGLGEGVVQGAVNPDEFYVYKPALRAGRPAILKRGVGGKATKMVYTDDATVGRTTEFVDVDPADSRLLSLTDAEVEVAAGTFGVKLAGVADLGQAPLMLGGAIAAIGFVLAFVAWWLRRSDRVQQQLRDVEIDRRLRGRSEMEADLKQAELDTARQLAGVNLPDLPAAETLLAAEQEHVGRIDRLAAQLEGLVGKEPPEGLPERRDTAALDIEQKTHALEALGPIAKEPRARERLEAEVRDLETALESARDDEANARARVEANGVDAEQVAGHSERLGWWEEQLAALQRKARVYERTLREIELAEQATMRTATRFLERRMVGDVERVTGGRYRRVAVDDRTLDIRLFAPEKSDWVDVRALSQGTLDLVYLAARLGLVRLVTGDRRPPLILDDPFVTLDDDRAARALDLLREIARDFQVIYLTTSDRYDQSADSVVVLDGPTEVDDGRPEPTAQPEAVAAGAVPG